jgi:hypothetical protein
MGQNKNVQIGRGSYTDHLLFLGHGGGSIRNSLWNWCGAWVVGGEDDTEGGKAEPLEHVPVSLYQFLLHSAKFLPIRNQ